MANRRANISYLLRMKDMLFELIYQTYIKLKILSERPETNGDEESLKERIFESENETSEET